jgi:LysM repeat protein
MKILKIFGVVAGIHLFALLLIFANPGCSSTAKRAPVAADTMPKPAPAPVITVPSAAPTSVYTSPIEPAPAAKPAPMIAFNPDTPAAPAGAAGGSRIMPTRPDSAVAGVLTSEGVKDVTPATTYTVKSGDNFSTIAKRNGITVAQLTAANSLSPNSMLRPGQKLIIPSKALPAASAGDAAAKPMAAPAAASSAAAAARPAGDGVKYTVKPGDMLGTIARSFGVTVGDIAVANNISDPTKIRPGMELTIPPARSAGKGAKSAAKADTAKAPEPKAAFQLPPVAAPEPAPAVPVIRIDETPAPVPAPKS